MIEQNKQQPAAAQEAVAWVKAKPTAEGDYYVRGFNLFEPKQYEALVQVRMHHFDGEPAPELVCNLHESTSSDDMDDWSPIVEMSDDFEWRGPLFAAPVTAAPADNLHAHLLHMLEDAGRITGELHAAASTPAAPGIDLAALRARVVSAIERITSGTGQKDSPKGGSEALDAARWRYVRRKLCLTGNGDGTCGMQAINLPGSIPGWPDTSDDVVDFCEAAIDAAMQAGDAEVQP